MRHLLLAAALAASSLVPSAAVAQVSVQLRFDLPVVLPRMVVIEPGIQVVPQVNEEVFFVDGYYWVRHDARWYRSHDHRRGWVLVEERGVPPRLVRIPNGHYRHWDERRGHHDREDHVRAARERERLERDRHEREREHERREHERREREREQQREHERREREQQREHGKHDRDQPRDHDRKD